MDGSDDKTALTYEVFVGDVGGDPHAIEGALKLLKLPTGQGFEQFLAELGSGGEDHTRRGHRHLLPGRSAALDDPGWPTTWSWCVSSWIHYVHLAHVFAALNSSSGEERPRRYRMNTIRRLRAPSAGPDRAIPHQSRIRALTVKLARVLAVLALVLVPLLAPGGADRICQRIRLQRRPLSPSSRTRSWLPSSIPRAKTANRNRAAPATKPTDGPDCAGTPTTSAAATTWVRAPDAVADTTLGNTFLAIGKGFAAAAFWLDDQTKTGAAAEEAGIAPAMVQFDQIVASISNGMLGVYGTWLGVALMVVATIIIWNALKSNAAAVTRTVAIAGAAMAIGALFVGRTAKSHPGPPTTPSARSSPTHKVRCCPCPDTPETPAMY